jgi:hypothetical protein
MLIFFGPSVLRRTACQRMHLHYCAVLVACQRMHLHYCAVLVACQRMHLHLHYCAVLVACQRMRSNQRLHDVHGAAEPSGSLVRPRGCVCCRWLSKALQRIFMPYNTAAILLCTHSCDTAVYTQLRYC